MTPPPPPPAALAARDPDAAAEAIRQDIQDAAHAILEMIAD